MSRTTLRTILLGSCAAALIMAATPAAAQADPVSFDIPSQPMGAALNQFAQQSKIEILFSSKIARDLNAPAIQGKMEPREALAMLLAQSGLGYRATPTGSFVIEAADPQSGSAAGDGADGTVAALIVTAQKREEQIQDVPIAISAFTEKSLQEQKIEGGFDLLKAIPNVTFSKNNFTSYNFSIRGIGTKAVSATTDPGVAVSFNNIALIQNRLFEQEYFDVERVEVLRGPQGTLYGRNATAGVINVISAKPNLQEFSGWLKGEVGNYHAKRISAMVNVPLVEGKLGVRVAGALTDRQGYDYNSVTKNHVNGRDLWSARVTVAFNPTERIRSNLIWERFNEDDNRSRTGKQLCHRDPGLTELKGPNDTVGVPVYKHDGQADTYESVMRPAMFSQGCKAGSLYDESAFGVPNGLSLPFVFGAIALSADCSPGCGPLFQLGYDPATGNPVGLLGLKDPYAGTTQSRDLRTIASFRDPRYRAKADVIELNVDIDLTDRLTFTSQTAYDKDQVYSFQDFNRFNTQPIFNDTNQIVFYPWLHGGISPWRDLAPGGQFCDPQLGCSKSIAGFDISQAKSSQFSQEVRLQSDFEGPLNFSVGANYTRFNVLVDYYVFYNMITAYAMMPPFNTVPDDAPAGVQIDITKCGLGGGFAGGPEVPIDDPLSICPYIDPNPIESINGEGHNYFRSKNPYRLKSAAAFGELYWRIDNALKLTAGLRYTDDRKRFIPVPSQILLAPGLVAGGTVGRGYPELPPIDQHWGEWTGRLGVDWKPTLSFTDQTLLYAFYSRGYKGGGANPPSPGFATLPDYYQQAAMFDVPSAFVDMLSGMKLLPVLKLTAVEYGRTFKPEFVNAFEVGAKNTLLGGAMTFNTDAFFYDYKDYQVSQIRDRTAVNENFDAQVWGLEFETRFAPSRDLQFIANLGYLDTKIGDGMKSIDIMDRTAGNAGWIVMKPWPQLPSNCIVPVGVAQNWATTTYALQGYWTLCGGLGGIVSSFYNTPPVDPATGLAYDPAYYNGTDGRANINGGAGFAKDLSGNELPNSPHWTMNFGAQYGHDILDGSWRATVRADAYWQSQSWARVYNDNPYDKLHGWYNVNLSVWFERPDDDLKIELYAKNLLDKTPITDAFLNSDDTALTTNVFVLDPRLIGLSIRKGF
jgi:outer membrane receptor protein involved in Fe transport